MIDVVATFLAALSGGIMRDVLLQQPPVAFTELVYMPTAIVAAFVGFFFISLARRGGTIILVLSYEMPELVKPGPINYLAAILGSILYVALVRWAHVDKVASEWVTIVFVCGLRMLSLKCGIRAPQPVDLPAKLPGIAAAETRRRRRRRRDDGGA